MNVSKCNSRLVILKLMDINYYVGGNFVLSSQNRLRDNLTKLTCKKEVLDY